MPIRQTLEGGKVPVRVWTGELDAATRQQLLNVAQLPIVHHHVAAMPDVHLGKGATVGSVIATKKAIIPSAVGVDIGCFVGETKIPLLNGMQRSLKDLTSETEPFWVYSIGADGNIVPGKARALKTRTDADLVVVTVSGGDEIVCTPDHKFMLSDGTYVEAKDLRFNTSLMPLYRRWQSRDGYESCSNGKKGTARLTHEMVYESLFGPIPDGFVIHHSNPMHFDNSPGNLCLMEAYPNPAALRWHKQPAHSYNHKVISVRPAGYRADVYCLTVEEHHNFALAADVFVHNCGMCAARTTLTAQDLDEATLKKVFGQIARDVPLGFQQHGDDRRHVDEALPLEPGLTRITEKHPGVLGRVGKRSHWVNQLGTLGGGNHFIEVCLDEDGRVWVLLHSGSRGIGNAIGTHFIELARRDMQRLDAQLPDRDLAYLTEGTEHFDDYVEAVGWAQDYARANREVMMDLVLAALRRHTKPFEVTTEAIQCHHNYVEREHHFGEDVWVTRKGAIRAGKGELGIIPGSMGAQSYIVRGKGSAESFESSAHGAGRRLSRNAAKKQFTEKDLAAQTEGVVCRKDRGVVDEIPSAYKNLDEVMANQSDLVEVVHTLRQLLCVKG